MLNINDSPLKKNIRFRSCHLWCISEAHRFLSIISHDYYSSVMFTISKLLHYSSFKSFIRDKKGKPIYK